MKQIYVEPVIYLIAALLLFWIYRIAGRALTETDLQDQDIDKKKKVKGMAFFGAILFVVFFVIKVVTIISN